MSPPGSNLPPNSFLPHPSHERGTIRDSGVTVWHNEAPTGHSPPSRSEDLAKRQIDSHVPSQSRLAFGKGCDAVIDKTSRTAPYSHVATLQTNPAHPVGAAFASP